MKTHYIEFLNKNKGFRKEAKYFVSYEQAKKWGIANLENFNIDMIKPLKLEQNEN